MCPLVPNGRGSRILPALHGLPDKGFAASKEELQARKGFQTPTEGRSGERGLMPSKQELEQCVSESVCHRVMNSITTFNYAGSCSICSAVRFFPAGMFLVSGLSASNPSGLGSETNLVLPAEESTLYLNNVIPSDRQIPRTCATYNKAGAPCREGMCRWDHACAWQRALGWQQAR